MRRLLLLPLALLPLLTACGGDGGGSLHGEVTDVTRRLCVVDDANLEKASGDRVGRCFQADDAVLSPLEVGDCVSVDYESLGEAQLPRVTQARKDDGCATAR